MNEKKIVSVPSTFDNVVRRKDRSVSMRFTSNLELSSADLMKLDEMTLHSGWLLFSENEVTTEDIPDEQAPDREKKSKIQRLKAVYYLLWLKGDQSDTFEHYWDAQFEKLMDKLKEQLD